MNRVARFAEIAGEDGIGDALRSTRTYLSNRSFPLTYWGRVASTAVRPDRVHPWRPIWIDPHDVEWSYKRRPVHGDGGRVFAFDCTADAGRVVGGDWDRRVRVEYGDVPKVEATRDRFEDGIPWEETGLFDHLLDVIERRGVYDGCETEADLRERYERIDRLYEAVRDDGFASRAELCDRFAYRCRLDVPKVHVGRDGTFVHAGGSGNHRIAIARVLDVPIEVRVVVRHRRWQRLREELRSASTPAALSERARANLDHPDAEHLVPASWAD
ncbi:hypothetical protein [Halovivax sp.]|uniref:hypothetical protein n=1 Tax=Halovivax sp. TaxID=1935978 RepID=UPI0025C4629A|nr:hypothetical protein [Halovivax sp.]